MVRATIKAAVFTLVFLFFHEFVTASEAVFEHMKAGFLAWALVGIGERMLERRPASRLAALGVATAVVPWYLTVFWYMAPAILGGRIPTLWLHIVYSLVITFAGGLAAALTEETLGEDRRLAYLAGAIVVIEVALGIAFSNAPPYIDIFTVP